MPKDKGPGPHPEGCITAKVLQVPSFELQVSTKIRPKSQGLTYLANGFSLLIGDSWYMESFVPAFVFRRPGGRVRLGHEVTGDPKTGPWKLPRLRQGRGQVSY